MLKEIIVALVAGFVLFEFLEHVVFPLVWSFVQSRKGSPCDVSSMIGKVGEVRQWQGRDGKVFINGEIWNARSDIPLIKGDQALIERMQGFVLTVKRVPANSCSEK
jgi:membrane protein implicated in regulation of membrane protease activity